MRKTKYTTLPVKPQTAYILKRYAKIHGWAMTTFLDNLATMLYLGIDGLLEWDISELKKYYCYSDIVVASDVREAGWIPLKPIKKAETPITKAESKTIEESGYIIEEGADFE